MRVTQTSWSRFLADDWLGLGFDGRHVNKTKTLSDVKSGTYKLESFGIGPKGCQDGIPLARLGIRFHSLLAGFVAESCC